MATVEDLHIQGSLVRECAEPDGPHPACEPAVGDGIVVVGGAHLTLDRFVVTDNARVGINCAPVDHAPSVTATRGRVTGNVVGINLRGDSVSKEDFARVVCTNNEGSVDGCFGNQDRAVPDLSELTRVLNLPKVR